MITFKYYLEHKNGSKPRTIDSYRNAISAFLKISKNKDKIAAEDILKYIEHCYKNRYKNSTIKLRLVAIKTYCDYRGFDDIAQYISEVKLRKQQKKEVECDFTSDILLDLRDYQTRERKYRNRLLIDLLASTGGRVSEILALNLSNFRTNEDGLKVVDLYQTKIEEVRTVILTKMAEQSLNEYVRVENITDKTVKLFPGVTRFAADKILTILNSMLV